MEELKHQHNYDYESDEDNELDQCGQSPTIEDDFKKIQEEIEGLTNIVKQDDIAGIDLPEVSTADGSALVNEFSRRPSRPAVQADPAEEKVDNFLMQWVRKLIEEKKEADKTIIKLRERLAAKGSKDQSYKKNYEDLKIKAELLEKRIEDLGKLLTVAEIEKRSMEKTLEFAMQGRVQMSSLHALETSFQGENSTDDKSRLIPKKEEAKVFERQKIEIKESKERIKSMILSFCDKMLNVMNQGISKKLGIIKESAECVVDKVKEAKASINERLRRKLLHFASKLKSISNELNNIHKEIQEMRNFKYEILPFYRIF